MIIVLMGVSGCGKTTIGKLLSEKMSLPFFDADDFHPKENIDKMKQGNPLSDEDRAPWLKAISNKLQEEQHKHGAILACSALKEKYRTSLQAGLQNAIYWVHLEGNFELIKSRIDQRSGHYMSSALLNSQFETLEKPEYGITVPCTEEKQYIVEKIIKHLTAHLSATSQLGIIGLGVMGKNLALNLQDKGFTISVYNRQVPSKEVDLGKKFQLQYGAPGFDDLKQFIDSLEKPRKILIMINAGKPVDEIIDNLALLLEPGDVIMDGGNSYYEDSTRRYSQLNKNNIHFVGLGVSGGEEGARKGPSLMPGGSEQGYKLVEQFLTTIAAKDKNGLPCCGYMGIEGAGHFIKMVHNGIEYAEMQIISEVYYILKKINKLNPAEIAEVFKTWSKEGLNSYLISITIEILQKKEGQAFLIDNILDAAEQKGTGGWSAKVALDLGVPLSTISESVIARIISSNKSGRLKHSKVFQFENSNRTASSVSIAQLRDAYYVASLINHHVGFNMMQQCAVKFGWDLQLEEIARVWTNGCIIRSELMEMLSSNLAAHAQVLDIPLVVQKLKSSWKDLSHVVAVALEAGIALPVLSASINFFLASITNESPANIIQAQRDFFGAHTFQRVDKDGYFHANWNE